MSNVEIEDVLSSIRRLVSENATRPRPGAGALSMPQAATSASGDALVLTPALRVEKPEQSTAPDPVEEPAGAGEPGLDAVWQEAAGSDRAAGNPPQTFEFDAGAGATAPEQTAGGLLGETPHESADDAGGEDPLQSRVAGLEAAFHDGGDFEPDGSEVTENKENFEWERDAGNDTVIDLSTADVPAGRLHFTGETDAAPEPGASVPDSEEDAGAAEAWPEPEEDWTAPELPRPAESPEAAPPLLFRSAHRGPDADPVPGGDVAPVLAADVVEAGDDMPEEAGDALLEAEVAEEGDGLDGYVVGTEDRPDAGDSPGEPDPWEGDEGEGTSLDPAAHSAALNALEAAAVIDEAWLTDLVAEVVRTELRGRMGERITQNVRKLVRREIARALETRGIR